MTSKFTINNSIHRYGNINNHIIKLNLHNEHSNIRNFKEKQDIKSDNDNHIIIKNETNESNNINSLSDLPEDFSYNIYSSNEVIQNDIIEEKQIMKNELKMKTFKDVVKKLSLKTFLK
jgi:hypothetical protein